MQENLHFSSENHHWGIVVLSRTNPFRFFIFHLSGHSGNLKIGRFSSYEIRTGVRAISLDSETDTGPNSWRLRLKRNANYSHMAF